MARRPADAKTRSLKQHGCLNPHAERVRDELFLSNPFFDPRDLLQVRYEMLRRVREDGVPVSHAAASFGVSRPTWYQARRAWEAGGLPGLLPDRPGPRRPGSAPRRPQARAPRGKSAPSRLRRHRTGARRAPGSRQFPHSRS